MVRIEEKKLTQEYLKENLNSLDLSKPIVLYFFGTEDPTTRLSWCPDCVKIDPLIRKLAKDLQIELIEVPVGDRNSWKDKQNNFYRTQSYIPVTSVPTLVRIDLKVGDRSIDRNCVGFLF